MPVMRALSVLLVLPWFFGCAQSSSDTLPKPQPEQTQAEKIHIYLSGQTPPSPQFSKRIGEVSGQSCMTGLLKPATEEAALQTLRNNAAAQNATAVVDVNCVGISFAMYQSCWPGVICRGEAMQ